MYCSSMRRGLFSGCKGNKNLDNMLTLLKISVYVGRMEYKKAGRNAARLL